jgi:hypothetical protein
MLKKTKPNVKIRSSVCVRTNRERYDNEIAATVPKTKAPPILKREVRNILIKKNAATVWADIACDIANETANIMRHHASSIAVTLKRVSVKIPLARYSLITITVAAGAVADAIAPKRSAI